MPKAQTAKRPTLRQRFEFRAARLLFGLPASVQVRLSGRPPVVVDGHVLHPQMQLLLALRARWRGPSQPKQTAAEARRELRAEVLAIAGRPIAVGSIADVSSNDGMAARHYVPTGSGHQGLLVYYHGGGFVAGGIDTHDGLCRRICSHAGIHVLSVDYRLAPEHPFPAAVDDAFTAFRWVCARAESLGIAADRIAVGGDSAGGNLATVVCLRAVADGGPAPCAQVLLYPVIDRTRSRPSLDLFADGFLLTRSDIDWYQLQYTGTTVAQPEPEQYPLCAKDLSGLAPALIVTAGFDPLRDEGEAYAAALQAAGVAVLLRRFDGLLHGFCSMATISPACEAAVRDLAADIRTIIGGGGAAAGKPRAPQTGPSANS